MDASNTVADTDKALHFDVYRTIVLGHYMRHWGMPEYRRVARKSADQSFFEVYWFPSKGPVDPFRIASVGLAEAIKPDGEPEGNEYLMVLPGDLGGADRNEVFNYFIDLAVHIVANSLRSCLPRLLEPSALAPDKWGAKALLIDEATGESEDFGTVSIGDKFDIEIQWLIPLREAEYKFILVEGIDAFDELVQSSDQSLADVNRAGLVGP